ncbi:protein vestigial [Hoplias malabaricus]|uniref:protein vestigial n=1 Tax=Hoplias malabaricus TaxID=27720 RepID=UPI0034628997
MEDRGRGQRQTQSVVHTYYQGDINTVVDEHFFRALNKTSIPKDLSTKSRENRRDPKPDYSAPPSWSKPGSSQCSSAEEHPHSQGVIMGPMTSDPWVYPVIQGPVYDMHSVYHHPNPAPPSSSSSYLHLLNLERPAGGPLTTHSSKAHTPLEWNTGGGQGGGARTQLDSGVQQLAEKGKDVYWY